jgi:hypothetical protein
MLAMLAMLEETLEMLEMLEMLERKKGGAQRFRCLSAQHLIYPCLFHGDRNGTP